MNIFAIISLLGAIISLSLGIFVLSKNIKNELNIIFMLLCFSIAILSFSEFEMRQAESFETAYFWFYFTGVTPIIVFFLFHFSLIFSEKYILKERKYIYFLIYIFAIFFISLNYVSIQKNI